MPCMGNAFDSTYYPTSEPRCAVRGARWAWKRTDVLSDYPAASYSWRWVARPERGIDGNQGEIAVAGSASGSDVIFEASITTTSQITLGRYRWQLQVTRTSDSEVIILDLGSLVVTADADDDTADLRSHARRALEIVERAIEGNTSPEVQSYAIAGRSVSRYSRAELMHWRRQYIHEVAAEDRAALVRAGRPAANRVRTRFGS